MNKLNDKTSKKILLTGLLGGILLAVLACGREAVDIAEPPAEQAAEDIAKSPAEQAAKDNEVIATNSSNEGFEGLPVLYSLDNSSRVTEPVSGILSGDWDDDGKEDTLTVITAEQEGSEIIKRLELALSSCPNVYLIEDADCDLIDIFSADFDADKEPEILLMFDMRYAGANGCCGLQLLDKIGSEYVNLADGFFTGSDYEIRVQTGEDSGYIINDKNGGEYFISAENVSGSAIAQVTGWYHLEVLEGAEKDHIRLKQYIAGEDMTDHVGDMVTVLSVEDDGLTICTYGPIPPAR